MLPSAIRKTLFATLFAALFAMLPATMPVALAIAILSATASSAQAQATPRAVLDKGLAVTGLTAADAPAWHIKANYKLNAGGNSTESGIFEEWYTSPFAWRRTYTEKKLTATEWSVTHARQLQTKDSKLNLVQLDQHVATVLTNPLFQAENLKSGVDLDGQAGTFAGLVLDCVIAADSVRAASKIDPIALYPRFCFDVKDSTLRYIHTPVSLISYTEFKALGNRQVATKVNVNLGGKVAADLEITTLEPLAAADQAQVTPPGNAVPEPYVHQSSDAPFVPVRINECSYPMSARVKQEYGVVYIPVIIKKDGSVKNNGAPIGPPELADASKDCISGWKFEPFTLDGEAIDVAETLIYNFDGKPFKGVVGYASEPAPQPAAPAAK
jgi:hypothetical protein